MLMFTLQCLKIIICVEPLKFVVTYLKSNLVMIFCYTSISMPNMNNSGNTYWNSQISLIQMQNGTDTLEDRFVSFL